MVAAADALVLDSAALTQAQVVNQMEQVVRSRDPQLQGTRPGDGDILT